MPRTFFFKCQTIPIQNHRFWSIFSWKHVFLGGAGDFLESQQKIQASHVQLIQDEAGVWESPAVGHVRLAAGKKHMIHPQKSTNVP